MQAFQNAVLSKPIVVVLLGVLLGILVVLFIDLNYKTAAPWIHRTGFLIRRTFDWLFSVIFASIFLFMVLPYVVEEGAMWLAPESRFGYAQKYGIRESNVYVQTKPHGCDFEDAPLGNKHCHFKKTLLTDKDSKGKVTAVYVNWDKVQD